MPKWPNNLRDDDAFDPADFQDEDAEDLLNLLGNDDDDADDDVDDWGGPDVADFDDDG